MKMIVRFKTRKEEQQAFEVLVDTGEKFSYIGNHEIEITMEQLIELHTKNIKPMYANSKEDRKI